MSFYRGKACTKNNLHEPPNLLEGKQDSSFAKRRPGKHEFIIEWNTIAVTAVIADVFSSEKLHNLKR